MKSEKCRDILVFTIPITDQNTENSSIKASFQAWYALEIIAFTSVKLIETL